MKMTLATTLRALFPAIAFLVLALAVASPSSAATGSAFSRTYVQKAYVAYYGRPADPAGLDYWASRMDTAGGSLDAIIEAFGNSDEFNRRYANLSDEVLVTLVYLQALGRGPDQAGFDFYVGELQAGRITLQTITLDVLNGATTAPDSTVVANKLDVANYYTTKVAAGCAYGSEQDGVNVLSGVTDNPVTVTAAKAVIDSRCGSTPTSCSGYPAIDLGDLDFDGARFSTYGLAGSNFVYARIVVPNPLPDGWAGDVSVISAFEFLGAQYSKKMYVTRTPCDFSAIWPAYGEGNSPSVRLSFQNSLFNAVTMNAGDIWYVTIKNERSNGAPSCSPNADCNFAIELSVPAPN
jgi:hypothetical protein